MSSAPALQPAPRTTWTREQVEAFLEKEKPKYQRIELPYGLVTGGEDRRGTAATILPERMDGKSLLDVGCFLGFFCHEALRRGATRATGVEIDADRLRQARGIADCLGLPVDLRQLDLEHDALPGVFDTVLCLNVLHHVYDPIAALDRLLGATRERLVLEIASTRSAVVQRILWGKNPIRGALHALLARQPMAAIGRGDSDRAYGFFYFSRQALENILLRHRGDVAKIDLLPSPFPDRFAVVVWKRRIDAVALVSGLPGSGMSTLSGRLVRGELAPIRATLGLDRSQDWLLATPQLLARQAEPHVPAMIYEYDILRGSPLMKCSFERDPTLDLVRGRSEPTPTVLLWVDPAVLAERLTRRMQAVESHREQRLLRRRIELVGDPARMGLVLRDWLAWCGRQGSKPSFVDATAEPRMLAPAEFRSRAQAAGVTLEV